MRSQSVPHFSETKSSLTEKPSETNEKVQEPEQDKEVEDPESKGDDVFFKEEEEEQNNETLQTASNITDDEKSRQITSSVISKQNQTSTGIVFETFLQLFNTTEYDELNSLIGLCFLHTLIHNPGVPAKFVELLSVKMSKSAEITSNYSEKLMKILIDVLAKSVEPDFKVRLATLELATRIIKKLTCAFNTNSFIGELHMSFIEQVKEQSSFVLRRQFKVI